MRRNLLVLVLALAPLPVVAQGIISAKAGLIHLAEGEVLLNNNLLEEQNNQFLSMKEGDVLATQEGRAEILLQPGSFLRIAENSSVGLTAATFEDTRLRLVSGSGLIEVDHLDKTASLQIELNGRKINLRKRGLYEFQAKGPGVVRVYEGELTVTASDGLPVRLKDSQQFAFNELTPSKFDKEDTTALYRWGARRARTLAAASQSSSGFHGNQNINTWLWGQPCGCYYYYMNDGMYTPYRTAIYLQPVYIGSNSSGFGNVSDYSAPVSSSAQASGTVSVGDSSGASAAPAPAAAPATSTNTSDRRR